MNTFPTILFFFTLYTPDRIVGSPKPENDVHFHINLGDNVQKQKLPTKETGEDYMERKSFRTSSKTPDGISDIQRIKIFDKAGDYSSEPVKQISLDGKNSEIAEVRPRPSVFAEDMEISECSQFGCEERRISRRERKKLEQCTFEGNLLSDPDSKVSLVACGSDGVKDIQVVSGRTDLESSAYRVKNDGSVTVSNATIEFDDVDIEDNGKVGSDHVGSNPVFGDYGLDFLAPPDYAYIDEEGKAVSVVDKDGEPNSCQFWKIKKREGSKLIDRWMDRYSLSECKKIKEDVKKRSKEQENDGLFYNKTIVDSKNWLRFLSGSFKTQMHSWHKKTKTYNQKTIELGVYIDNALYQQIQKIVGKPDDQMVQEKIKEFVHGIFVNVEDFLTHETFTTIKGGFKVLVNDLIILKGDAPMEAQLNKQTSLDGLIDTLRALVDDFDNSRRKSKKGEKSIDARYLLTGMDLGPLRGLAYPLTMCYKDNIAVSNIKFDADTGKADQMTAQVVAHEIAHILGAYHDGGTIHIHPEPTLRLWDGVKRRYHKKKIPCPIDTYFMGPIAKAGREKEWSQCTRHQIDEEDKLRVKYGLDCLSVGS